MFESVETLEIVGVSVTNSQEVNGVSGQFQWKPQRVSNEDKYTDLIITLYYAHPNGWLQIEWCFL